MRNRYFSSDPAQNSAALALYDSVADLPLICPHGHVDPRLFADANYQYGSPVDLLIIPDHYIFRMLYSQGISLDELGIPALPPVPEASGGDFGLEVGAGRIGAVGAFRLESAGAGGCASLRGDGAAGRAGF
jgi:hypothetical protein